MARMHLIKQDDTESMQQQQQQQRLTAWIRDVGQKEHKSKKCPSHKLHNIRERGPPFGKSMQGVLGYAPSP